VTENTIGIPESIQIGPLTYRVERSSKAIRSKSRAHDSVGVVGYVDFVDETITLDPDLSHENQIVNIIHEVCHALWQQAAINFAESCSEEQVVTALAYGLTDVIRCNKPLEIGRASCR
jgi:hypothetical protein